MTEQALNKRSKMMYMKILSALTATFLVILFAVMAQTVPSATSFEIADQNHPFLLLKVMCSEPHFSAGSDLKRI